MLKKSKMGSDIPKHTEDVSEELKPCPFCGSGKVFVREEGYATCPACYIDSEYETPEHWNNAWAHKRIEELEKEKEELRMQLLGNGSDAYAANRVVALETRVAELETELKKTVYVPIEEYDELKNRIAALSDELRKAMELLQESKWKHTWIDERQEAIESCVKLLESMK